MHHGGRGWCAWEGWAIGHTIRLQGQGRQGRIDGVGQGEAIVRLTGTRVVVVAEVTTLTGSCTGWTCQGRESKWGSSRTWMVMDVTEHTEDMAYTEDMDMEDMEDMEVIEDMEDTEDRGGCGRRK